MTGKLEISLPTEVVPYRDDLRRFVEAMVYKLAKNAHKGRWEDMPIDAAVARLEEERQELIEAINGTNNFVEVLLEAADAANFAMIVASIATERGQ